MNPKLLVLVSVVLSGVAQVFLKQGMIGVSGRKSKGLGGLTWSVLSEPFVWAWAMTFVVATASWLVGLQRVDLSYAYPLVSLGYVLVAVLAIVFFHERIDYTRWTAIAVLSVGVILIASS